MKLTYLIATCGLLAACSSSPTDSGPRINDPAAPYTATFISQGCFFVGDSTGFVTITFDGQPPDTLYARDTVTVRLWPGTYQYEVKPVGVSGSTGSVTISSKNEEVFLFIC